uniref:Uncharacterized protein n=1 Tax=Octopus bimaculoides TaxID=37653 RepID=A0A0L8HTD3_OCTBM
MCTICYTLCVCVLQNVLLVLLQSVLSLYSSTLKQILVSIIPFSPSSNEAIVCKLFIISSEDTYSMTQRCPLQMMLADK